MAALHRDALGPRLIRSHAHGLAELAAGHAPSTPVPTCGDWTLADLAWHLTEVQHFWVWIVEHRPAGPETYPEPIRPGDGELPAMLRGGADRLADLLASLPDDEPAWSWSDDETVGFTVRRQTHEALIHHVDALSACGKALPPIDPPLAADGVDELVRVMLGGVPDWAVFTPDGTTTELVATDTDDRWPLRSGRMTGTSPTSGNTYDLAAYEPLAEPGHPTTSIRGPALDLDLWLWGRAGRDGLEITGEPSGADAMRAAVVDATQ